MPKLSVQTYYPVTVPIDGEPIACRIARLSAREFFTFAKEFDRVSDPVSERKITIRVTDEELAKHPVPRARTRAEDAAQEALEELRTGLAGLENGAVLTGLLTHVEAALPPEPTSEEFVISDEEIRKRRLEEMTDVHRAAWEKTDAEDERFAASFIVDTVARYVTVEPGEIEVDDAPLTSGADLVRVFGGQTAALKALVRAVREENVLPTALKNAWRSARATTPSSNTPDLAVPGTAPGKTAASAEPKGSAPAAAATADPSPGSSGATATSS